MKIKVKKLHPDAKLPTYGSNGAACFDLYALSHERVTRQENPQGAPWRTVIHREHYCVFGTGLAFDIPEGHVMMVYSRSGHGFKENVRLANCVGIIDSDYTGEVKVKLANDTNIHGETWGEFGVHRFDRIAQAMIIPVQQVSFEEVETLKETTRGASGCGSTGA
jgi:dUTP pyrophosphatase